MKKYRAFYLVSLLVILVLSAYPIYMGITLLSSYFENGFVHAANYKKYVIPYTPMCIAIIISAIILPIIYRYAKRFSNLITSAIGVGAFLITEVLFEQIKVMNVLSAIPVNDLSSIPIEDLKYVDVQSWQLSLCMATPEVLVAIGSPLYTEKNPVYKVHFYIIAILIIICVIGLLYGFTRMFREERYEKKKPLTVQSVSLLLFIGLCVLACFTAFYRNGTLYISPLSSFLTGLFFVVFGVTAGLYISGFTYGKKKILSVYLPAMLSAVATIVMYIGELVLMDGELFRFGRGFFFERMGVIPFSACDMVIIFVSGVITCIIAAAINKKKRSENAVNAQ